MQETALYAPIKAFLEGQGYTVKAEVQDCDLVAVRENEAPLIVEMKLSLSMALLLQGVDRLGVADAVYVATLAGKGKRWRNQKKDAVNLCRRLGLGLISVRFANACETVEIHVDPGPYKPRKAIRRQTALLREFQRRVGDPNIGGQNRRPIVTAYRQDALRIAHYLANGGPDTPANLARRLGVSNAASILQKDHYGWFRRISRGLYEIDPAGTRALETYKDVVTALVQARLVSG